MVWLEWWGLRGVAEPASPYGVCQALPPEGIAQNLVSEKVIEKVRLG